MTDSVTLQSPFILLDGNQEYTDAFQDLALGSFCIPLCLAAVNGRAWQ